MLIGDNQTCHVNKGQQNLSCLLIGDNKMCHADREQHLPC